MFKKKLFYRYSRLCAGIGVEVAVKVDVAFQLKWVKLTHFATGSSFKC
jgi:hypothetical protein